MYIYRDKDSFFPGELPVKKTVFLVLFVNHNSCTKRYKGKDIVVKNYIILCEYINLYYDITNLGNIVAQLARCYTIAGCHDIKKSNDKEGI